MVRAERGNEVVICLVGNKTDLGNEKRQVSTKEGEESAKKEGLFFMECSAKAGVNIKSLFEKLAVFLAEGAWGDVTVRTITGAATSSEGKTSKLIDIKLSAAPVSVEEAKNCGC